VELKYLEPDTGLKENIKNDVLKTLPLIRALALGLNECI